jgi:mxaJ protein
MSNEHVATRQTRDVSRWEEWILLLVPVAVLLIVVGGGPAASLLAKQASPPPALKVCADPNNLPFSNRAAQGFENRIAELIGRELKQPVEYTWWAQRRGFVRSTLNSGACDLVVGTSAGMDMLATTRPYYKSTYVFVTRRDRHLNIRSFDDPKLRHLKIGVQMIGDDFVNTPPAHALTNRGMVNNLVGFTVYGDYRKPNPPARIVEAVADGKVDVAVVWGPLAGYFAARSRVPLDVVPVRPQVDLPYLPFVFDIAMGVRRRDSTFRHQLDDIIERRRPTIDSILATYGVPRADVVSTVSTSHTVSPAERE